MSSLTWGSDTGSNPSDYSHSPRQMFSSLDGEERQSHPTSQPKVLSMYQIPNTKYSHSPRQMFSSLLRWKSVTQPLDPRFCLCTKYKIQNTKYSHSTWQMFSSPLDGEASHSTSRHPTVGSIYKIQNTKYKFTTYKIKMTVTRPSRCSLPSLDRSQSPNLSNTYHMYRI